MDISVEKAKADLKFAHNALWREYIVSPCNKYCYLTVPKNASNTYRKALRVLNWKAHRFDPGAEHYIAHISNPTERWIKGFAQFCLTHQIDVAKILKDKSFLFPAIYDNHTMPISHIWCDKFDKTKFFKLGTSDLEDYIRPDYDIKILINHNVADDAKIRDYRLIRHALKNKMHILSSFLFHDDIKFQDLEASNDKST